MLVTVSKDTFVRIGKGTVLELPEHEAKRLIALKVAEVVKEKKTRKK